MGMSAVAESRKRLAFVSASPHQGYLRLLGPPSGRGADGGARTRDRRVSGDLRADSQATVPTTPPRVEREARSGERERQEK
ncbi:hypothetical protein PoB_000341700 [Plakobranchus ocellatus]|uniref:Uncharacterized protein n=1 Tax=Plakobranchus ocellatus TaxID=259542 RepID=A0AAV3Y4A2_9GAST|nr:hypothetical protein PoB_000341700 [Plakobranchus ocellatus]